MKEQIIELYKQGTSITQLSKQFNCHNTTIKYILAKAKLYGKEVKIHQNIINEYLNGESLTNLGKKYKCRRQNIAIVLLYNGYDVENRQNRTKFNETIFDSIDTEEKAYWLGFIFADGYISSSKYTFEISLKGADKHHLDKFNNFMQHEDQNHVKLSNIKLNGKIFERCRWSVTNKHLWKTLNNLGCTPQKSLTLQFPNLNIFKTKNLICHFIRGYFDGDGSFSRTINARTVSPNVSLLGTYEFLSQISNVSTIKGHFLHDKRHDQNTHIMYFTQFDTIIFLDYIYRNASIYLDRKYNLYLFFQNGRRSLEEFNEWSSGKIEESPEVDNIELTN